MSKIYKAWAVNMDAHAHVIPNKAAADEHEEDAHVENDDVAQLANVEELCKEAKNKAKDEALRIVDKASMQAGKMLDDAKKEIDRRRETFEAQLEKDKAQALLQAEEKGYADGYKKGEADANVLIKKAEAIKDEAIKERQEAIARLEPQMVEMILGICDKLIGANLVKPDVIVHLARQGLAQTSFNGDVALRVSKDDYEHVLAAKDELMGLVPGGYEIEIVKDFSLSAGDCLIETQFGLIDSSLNMQLEEVKESLRLILSATRGEIDGNI